MEVTWASITNGMIDVDSPVDEDLLAALRDNLQALWTGVATAPGWDLRPKRGFYTDTSVTTTIAANTDDRCDEFGGLLRSSPQRDQHI